MIRSQFWIFMLFILRCGKIEVTFLSQSKGLPATGSHMPVAFIFAVQAKPLA
jgi:hypothetical protein